VHGEGVGRVGRHPAPDGFVDLLAGDHAVDVLHQESQQSVFAQWQRYHAIVEANLQRCRVQDKTAAHERRFERADAVRTDGAHDRDQLRDPVRSRNACGRAGGERRPRVRAVADSHDDGDAQPVADGADDGGAAEPAIVSGKQHRVGSQRSHREQRVGDVGAHFAVDMVAGQLVG
jgi:hypothetical protein